MSTTSNILFSGFYQFGFVASDLDAATAYYAENYGIKNFRRKQVSEWMESAHCWAGDVMIELLQLKADADPIYDGYAPDNPEAVRLHHHGYRIADISSWNSVEKMIEKAGFGMPMRGAVMNGDLRYIYADTRAHLGVYSEFVYLTGSATKIYDDLPHN